MRGRYWALALVFAAAGVSADEVSRARACTRIADGAGRLACFDAAFAASTAPSPGAVAQSVSPAVSMTAATAVGAAVTRDPVAGFGDRGQLPAEKAAQSGLPKRLNYKLAKSESLAGGLFRLTMDNGQVWVTKEADWALEFSAGDEVMIQRMVLGAYRVSHVGQGRNVTVARIQ